MRGERAVGLNAVDLTMQSLGDCFVKITNIFAYMATRYSAILPNVEVYNCEFGSPDHPVQVSGPPDTVLGHTKCYGAKHQI